LRNKLNNLEEDCKKEATFLLRGKNDKAVFIRFRAESFSIEESSPIETPIGNFNSAACNISVEQVDEGGCLIKYLFNLSSTGISRLDTIGKDSFEVSDGEKIAVDPD
jgi:hypothetical protein